MKQKKKPLTFSPLRSSHGALIMHSKPRTVRSVMMTAGVVDKQGDLFMPQALVGAAQNANGSAAVRQLIEHDRTVPPWGKLIKAWVGHQPNGFMQMVGETEVLGKSEEVELPDGTIGLYEESKLDARPYIKFSDVPPPEYVISVDAANFGSIEDYQHFMAEITEASGFKVQAKNHSRKSHIPPPEVLLHFSEHLAAMFSGTALGKKLIDKVGDKLSATIAEDVDKFYRLIRSTAISAAKRMLPHNRPITYLLTAAGEPEIMFAITTADPSVVIAATNLAVMEAALHDAAALHARFDATEMQYIWDSGKWTFNFLMTTTGAAIGTKTAFRRRAQSLAVLSRQTQQKQVQSEVSAMSATDIKSDERKSIDAMPPVRVNAEDQLVQVNKQG